jgi:hypothetical protein
MTNQTIAARMSALAKAVTSGSNPVEAIAAIKAEVSAIEAEVEVASGGFTLHSIKAASGDNGRVKADFRTGNGDGYVHVLVYAPDARTAEAIGEALNASLVTA